jgi:hypothetical protein
MRGSVRWGRIEALASVAAIVAGLAGIGWQLNENRKLQRQVHAIEYCEKYYFNRRIRDLIEYTRSTSDAISDNYKNLFKQNKVSSKVVLTREQIKKDLYNDEKEIWYVDKAHNKEIDIMQFYELFNFFAFGMVGVVERALDQNIIENCIAVQVICFKEKYHYRIPLFSDDPRAMSPMRQIDEFIRHAKIDFNICRLVTDDLWHNGAAATRGTHIRRHSLRH